jgi:sensor histidine kinase YesM
MIKKYRYIIILTLIAAIIIPGFFSAYYFLEGSKLYYQDIVQGIIFTVIATLVIGFADFKTIDYLQKKYPWQHDNVRRFLLELLITSVNAVVIISLLLYLFYLIFNKFNITGLPNSTQYLINIIISLIVNTIAVAIYEGSYLFNQWKNVLLETEKLKTEKAESQYAALKSQVNPHFLFNSLNSLSSLIRVSPEKAIDFVDKFSKIYRYVLDMNDKMVVELKEELEFLQSYYFLQKIRFGNNLEIDINIDANKINEFIPPLSLQILIENAIKHNEISSEKPLKISIYIENNFLIISNNLQLKNTAESSTGIGLVNIKERYMHLTDERAEFFITNDNYIAKLPLLGIS